MVEFSFSNSEANPRVLDAKNASHIYVNMQGWKKSRWPKNGKLFICAGNGRHGHGSKIAGYSLKTNDSNPTKRWDLNLPL